MDASGRSFSTLDEMTFQQSQALLGTLAGYLESMPFEHTRNLMRQTLPAAGAVLDVSTGTGQDATWLSRQGYKITGVDLRDDLITPDGWELRKGRAENLPVEDDTQDAVWANLVIQHLPDPYLFYREAFRVLKTSGILVASWPCRGAFNCPDSKITQIARDWLETAGNEVLNPQTPDSVYTQMCDAGFQSVRMLSVSHRLHGHTALGYGFPFMWDSTLTDLSASHGEEAAQKVANFRKTLETGRAWVDLALVVATGTR